MLCHCLTFNCSGSLYWPDLLTVPIPIITGSDVHPNTEIQICVAKYVAQYAHVNSVDGWVVLLLWCVDCALVDAPMRPSLLMI